MTAYGFSAQSVLSCHYRPKEIPLLSSNSYGNATKGKAYIGFLTLGKKRDLHLYHPHQVFLESLF